MLVGAGVLRAGAAGYALERLEEKHYKAIHKAMEQALGDGALGVSLGLGYAPECFYTTEELMRALSPLAGQCIPVTVHMRQEGGGVLEALEEMLTVARKLRIPVHISHLKAMGRGNWGVKIPRALSMLEQATASTTLPSWPGGTAFASPASTARRTTRTRARASRKLRPCGGRIPWTAAAICWYGSTARSPWWTLWPPRRTS